MKSIQYALLATCVVVAACSDSSTGPGASTSATATLITPASATAPAYIKLGTPAAVVAVSNPTTSTDWDIRLTGLGVALNGGSSGPGNVTGFCLCNNATKTDAQILALTSSGESAAFESVTAANIPPASSFVADSIVPGITGWYTGTTANPGVTYLVHLASASGPQVKFHVLSLTGATASNPGTLAIEYASRTSSTTEFGTSQTINVPVPTTGTAYVNFSGTPTATITVTTTAGTAPPATWDIAISGYRILLNGGVSGSGGASVVAIRTLAYTAVTAAPLTGLPSAAFSTDIFGGVFAATDPNRMWYKYNLDGTHQISPTFNTYLVKTASGVYKVQLTSYYNTAGVGENITLRYAKISN